MQTNFSILQAVAGRTWERASPPGGKMFRLRA